MVLGISTATASGKTNPNKNYNVSSASLIEGYTQAKTTYDANLLSALLHEDVVMRTGRQNQVLKHGKSELIRFYKQNPNVKLNCVTSCEMLSVCYNVVMARVDLQFPNFVQQNYLTMERNNKGEWKITQINMFYI